jgi:hypothetical protein
MLDCCDRGNITGRVEESIVYQYSGLYSVSGKGIVEIDRQLHNLSHF